MWNDIVQWLANFFSDIWAKYFGYIIDTVSNFAPKVKEWFDYLCKNSLLQWSLGLTLMTGLWKVFSWVLERIQDVFAQMSTLQSDAGQLSGPSLSFGNYYAFANHYAPLSEVVTGTMTLISCVLLSHLIRSIKAWIPTLA